jgi:hypothetical protein
VIAIVNTLMPNGENFFILNSSLNNEIKRFLISTTLYFSGALHILSALKWFNKKANNIETMVPSI